VKAAWKLASCALIAAGALAACTAQTFVKSDFAGFKNRETTYAQVVAKIGYSRKEDMRQFNGQPVKAMSYGYVAVGSKPLHEGMDPVRVQWFYFHNDVLVGHHFVSTLAEDNTNFDETKVKGIVRGRTTRAEVIDLLGSPSGYYVYPMIAPVTGEAALYFFADRRGSRRDKTYLRKTLAVIFSEAGIVRDFRLTEDTVLGL
jgi:outer membrane protein assembly factor BamE (lipoprotein component of BamABCDE complex)